MIVQKVFHQSESTGIHGHMAKTKRQIIEDLKLIDVVVEILDARIPVASQNPDIGKWIEGKKKLFAGTFELLCSKKACQCISTGIWKNWN